MDQLAAPLDAIDAAYRHLLEQRAGTEDRWLLVQTLATAVSRRALLGALGIQAGWRVLDVGTGFGPLALEAACGSGAKAVGVDLDHARLASAVEVAGQVRARGVVPEAGTAAFVQGDLHRLPFAAGTFDAAAVRFVYQYLPDPVGATRELARVLRPGGLACVVDVDDGLSLTFPEPPVPFRQLVAAFGALQRASGGDREVGRKLASHLDAGGLEVRAVLVLPQAAYAPSLPDEPARAFLAERLRIAGPAMVSGGFMAPAAYETAMAALSTQRLEARTTIEAHIAVVAHRPAR